MAERAYEHLLGVNDVRSLELLLERNAQLLLHPAQHSTADEEVMVTPPPPLPPPIMDEGTYRERGERMQRPRRYDDGVGALQRLERYRRAQTPHVEVHLHRGWCC